MLLNHWYNCIKIKKNMTSHSQSSLTKLPKKKTQVKVLHVCTQKENIQKMNLILLGNGHPEDGLAFKVLKMVDTVEYIKLGIAELNKKSEINTKTAITAINAIESYKKEIESIEKGENKADNNHIKTKAEKRAEIQKIIQITTTIIAALALCTTTYFGFVNSKKNSAIELTTSKTNRMIEGVPMTTRGGVYRYDVKRADTTQTDTIKK